MFSLKNLACKGLIELTRNQIKQTTTKHIDISIKFGIFMIKFNSLFNPNQWVPQVFDINQPNWYESYSIYIWIIMNWDLAWTD